MQTRRHIYDGLLIGLVGALALGLVVRGTVKDELPWIAVVFYLARWGILAVMAGMATISAFLARRRFVGGVLLALAVALAWNAGSGLAPSRSCEGRNGLRVTLWNIADGQRGWDSILRSARQQRPDILALVEARGGDRHFWEEAFPGYHAVALGRGLVVVSRYPLEAPRLQEFAPSSYSLEVTARSPLGPLRVLVIDVAADIKMHRLETVPLIPGLVPDGTMPTVVLGDFNTPVDSVTFAPMRARFHYALTTKAGSECNTWPMPLPVLSLDQIWLSRNLSSRCTDTRWTLDSDHAPVTVVIDWALQQARRDGPPADAVPVPPVAASARP